MLGRQVPEVGKQLVIWTDGLGVLGSVVWKDPTRSSVAFEASLEPSTLSYLEQQQYTAAYRDLMAVLGGAISDVGALGRPRAVSSELASAA